MDKNRHMNILYIQHYAGSPDMGMAFRPYYLSREWVKMGHNVTIIAGDYSHLRQHNPEVTKDFQTQHIDGIEYVWLKTGTYEGNGVARALTMERFVRKIYINAKSIVKKYEPDVVIASSTYPLDTYAAQKIARIARCRYVHEVHDMWPSTLYEIGGMSKNHPFVVLMQLAENSAYKHCDKCVSLLPYTEDYMVKHGLQHDKFLNIQNGVVEEEWRDYDNIPNEHRKFFEDNRSKFIVGYFGGHAKSNALDNILDVAKITDDNDIIYVLVGDGSEKERLIKRKEDEGINNLMFLDSIDKKAIPDLIMNFDCSIMTGEPSPLYRFGLCLNKMYDSMMGAKPIICAITANRTLVEEYSCGIQVNTGKIEDIKKAVIKIKCLSKSERIAMGNKGREAVIENYTYSKLAKKFIEEILKD